MTLAFRITLRAEEDLRNIGHYTQRKWAQINESRTSF